ncbi:MAG TPA: hypothetical protein VLT90_04230, partial [Terriglobales bacterium]|nr:hypothetical protein [Terriglobales bacterium]
GRKADMRPSQVMDDALYNLRWLEARLDGATPSERKALEAARRELLTVIEAMTAATQDPS